MHSGAVFQRSGSPQKGCLKPNRGKVLSGWDFTNHKFGEWEKVRVTDCKTVK